MTFIIQEIVQENDIFPADFKTAERTGGGGIVGYNHVANADPTGYTLAEAITPAMLLKPFASQEANYNPADLSFIACGGAAIQTGAVAADSDIESGQDYVDALRDGAQFSAVSNTSSLTVNLLALGSVGGLYDPSLVIDRLVTFGIGETTPAVIRGDVELTGLDLSVVVDFVNSGDLKIPLFFAKEDDLPDAAREVAPEADTLDDLDLSSSEMDTILSMYPSSINNAWFGPPGLDDSVQQTLEAGFEEAITSDAYKSQLEENQLGIPVFRDGEETQQAVQTAVDEWNERDELVSVWE
jgi:tripartite-type tricarboxylate transporter receptor subunit TctC